MNTKTFFLVLVSLFLNNSWLAGQSQWPHKPNEQLDADGKIIKGRANTHHWQPYMANADLSKYHHAPQSAIEQFNDMKYGIRIHWGIYSIVHGRESWVLKNKEFTDVQSNSYQGFYHDLYKSWYPFAFNANEWTDMMLDCGFKFFVFTTKHHDGFSMYNTKTVIQNRFIYFGDNVGKIESCNISYSIMETPFSRDVTGELIHSARTKGIKIGLYYSHPDWYDADFRFDQWNPNRDENYSPFNNPKEYTRFKKRHEAQIKELLTQYGKIDMLSFDMWLPEFAWKHMQDVSMMAREIQPECMLRWRGIGNFGDYHTPENYIPGDESQGTMAWQVIHALSTRNYFSYEPDPNYIRSGDWIVAKLIEIVSKGGNLMIGIGPDLTGAWNPKAIQSLKYTGDWLKVNGEAIYNTRPCVETNDRNIYFTKSKDDNIVYAISLGWPGSTLIMDNIKIERDSKIYLLGYSIPLKWKKKSKGIEIFLPDELQMEQNRPCEQAYAFRMMGQQY